MCPPPCSAVPSAGPLVGVVTVLVALLDSVSDEQLAVVSRPARASRESGKRDRERRRGWKMEVLERAAFGLRMEEYSCHDWPCQKPKT